MPSDADTVALGQVVRVAVIDSGVFPDHPHVMGVDGGVAITPSGEDADYIDRIGHGTAVAGAIREKAPHASLIAVKVFDRALAGSVSTLVRAIDWAVEHDCHVINMSLGTSRAEHHTRLRPVVDRALERGVIVVAAREDGGQQFLPGSLPGVLGVMVDWDCPRTQYRVESAGEHVICHASGYPREIPGVPPSRNLMGISFAVANMTGFVARVLEASIGDRRNIVELLALHSRSWSH
jgi:subtilisin family serine protease